MTNGMAPMVAKNGMLIAFACAPGAIAIDRAPNSRNGVFTYHLLENIIRPEEEILMLLTDVSGSVVKDTNGMQQPHVSFALTQRGIYLAPQPQGRLHTHKTQNNDKEEAVLKQMPEPILVDKAWLNLQFHDPEETKIKKPDELAYEITEPNDPIDMKILDRVQGSILGMALGDALGAHVAFRPRHYLRDHPVNDLYGGGTWGLKKGKFTGYTSMALCLANSLIACHGFNPYDQLVRYKWWFHHGYMSSTGNCFDIGAAATQSLREFELRQKLLAKEHNIPFQQMDGLSDYSLLQKFDVYCSEKNMAGNRALVRLTPVPLFFYRLPREAVEYSGISGQITHGDQKAYDACRYYGALIVAALHGYSKGQLFDDDFYSKHYEWFDERQLHPDIESIAKGSYKKPGGYEDGIRGKGYIVSALEAALWAFWSDDDSFVKGALAAVNLGDDTSATAAIYGQLAGAYYGYWNHLPYNWLEHVYAKEFMEKLSKWIVYEGACWRERYEPSIGSLQGMIFSYDNPTLR